MTVITGTPVARENKVGGVWREGIQPNRNRARNRFLGLAENGCYLDHFLFVRKLEQAKDRLIWELKSKIKT
jgi:hypothetical protein